MNSLYYSIEHTVGDDVAITSLVLDNSNSTYYIPVHIFDVSTTSFINSQVLPVIEKTAFNNEMLYLQEDSTLLLLHTNFYPIVGATNSVIYNLKPYRISSYTSNTIYDTLSRYNSLDRFSSNYFLATGESLIKGHDFLIKDWNTFFQSKCIDSQQHTVTPTNTPTYNLDSFGNNYFKSRSIKKSYPQLEPRSLLEMCTD